MAEEPDIVEIRVHGVGNQSGYRALGDPDGTALNGWVELRRPPPLPAHPLKLINWWRANRRQTGRIWWYLAFPFTLVNVAGRMTPEPGHRTAALLHRASVFVTGVLLTLAQLAWVTVLAETILKYLPAFADPTWLGRLTPIVAATGLAVLLIVRWRRVVRVQTEDPGTPLAGLCIHVGVVVLGGVLLAVLRPAQLNYGGWPSVSPPASHGASLLDAMAMVVMASTAVVMLFAGLLCAVYGATPAGRRTAVRTLPMTGMVLTAAMVLMHTVTALVRMAADNLASYISGLLYPGHRGALEYPFRVLLPYDDPGAAGDSRLDLLPFQSMILVLALVVALVAVLVARTGLKLSALFSTEYRRALWWHDFIGVLPAIVPTVAPVAGVLGIGGVVTAVQLGEGNLGGPLFGIGVLLLQLTAAVVILSMLLGQFPAIREIMAKIGDLAGFWPVHDHPLAGISYRQPVLAGIRLELEHCGSARRPVLFGHSQGSVLCAWLLAHDPPPAGPRPVFVSAGSPIQSLYTPLFPAYFTPELQARVASSVTAWANFWRTTDPLGGPIPAAQNIRLNDTAADPLGHGGYWDNPRIARYISGVSSGSSAFPPDRDSI